MEECESLDAEMTELQELQEFQCESSEAISQDDEDEVEELHNSLREVVQDQSVKPKLQCLMVDPSFSMVTVQSEDSGIVWETASSRCSTPWASETSSISEGCSMEGSGAAGKITIVFDEEKIVRRRTRSGGRSSRLGDRLSRPGSSRSASALGVERLEMAEVSLPNVKQEKTQTEPDLEEIKNKDQQLFSLISEGYEILNIRVPSKLPTVDEEESTELQDNLSYLDQTPKIRSRHHADWKQQQNHVLPEEGEILDQKEPSEQDASEPSADTEFRQAPTQKDSTSDIDYFEKFTLVDVVVPGEQAPELQEEAEQPAAKSHVEEQKPAKETATDSLSASEDSFVFVTDVEIVGEHLDEVFYGEGPPPDALQRREDDEAEGGAGKRTRRESQRSGKESGSVLFGSEETVLTPIFISPGPPKIIDPILLEEPTAMSFMYSDLYEDAVGERRKSEEENSEAESVASEKSYKRRLSDSEEADGYLEKFTLKDETPTVQVQLESTEDRREGRMMWSQSRFEMTGCLTRVVKEEVEDKTKDEGAKTQEVSVEDKSEDLTSTTTEEKSEMVTETEQEISGKTEEKGEIVTEQEISGKTEEKGEIVTEQEISGKTEEKGEIVTEQEISATIIEKSELVTAIEQEISGKTEEKGEIVTEQEISGKTEEKGEIVTEQEISGKTEEKGEIVTEQEISATTEEKCELVTETEQEISATNAEKSEVVTEREISGKIEEKCEIVTETEHVREEIQPSLVSEEQSIRETSVELVDELREDQLEGQEVKHEVKKDETDPPESSTTEPVPRTQQLDCKEEKTEHRRETANITETELPCQTQEMVEKTTQVVEATEETAVIAPVSSEVPQIMMKSEIAIETTERSLSEEDATDTTMVAADETVVTEALAEAPAEVKEGETEGQEILTSTEKETSTEKSLEKEKEAAEVVSEGVASVEVIADCDAAVHAVVEVTEKAVDDKEIQTQVQIDLQEITSVETTDSKEEREALTEDTIVETELPEFLNEAVKKSEVKTEISSEVNESVVPEEVKTDKDRKQSEILEFKQHQQEESVIDSESAEAELMPEAKDKMHTEHSKTDVQEMVSGDDGLILLVPKGQAVEMDIEINQWPEKTKSDTMALSEPDSTCEHLIEPETTSTCPEISKEPYEETMTEPLLEVKPEVGEPETTSTCPETHQEPYEETMTESLLEVKPEVCEPETTSTCPETHQEPYKEIISEPLLEVKPEVCEPETTSTCPETHQEPYKETISEPLLEVKPEVGEPETTSTCPETHQEPYEETMTESLLEVKPEVGEPETTSTCPETHQEPYEETMTESLLEVKPEVALKEEEPPRKELDNSYCPPITVEEASTEGQKVESDFEEDKDVFSPLRSFTPQEDLSELHTEDMQTDADVEQKAEILKKEDASEIIIVEEETSPETHLHREDIGQKMELHEAVTEAPEVTVEELEYEVISKQDAKDMPEAETLIDAEEPKLESDQDRKRMIEMEMEMKNEEKVLDLSPEEELIEADYEIIDAEEESQARLAAELQGMDWYCLTCGCLLSEDDCLSQEHRSHEVTAVDKAYEEIKEKLSDWISELQGRSENIEDLVSELELAYNSVEDQCVETEAAMQVQNEEMMALVMEQYNNMSISMEEEKKAKLEQLYDQIVSFQESIDSAKATLETTAREAETDARSPEDIHASLKTALDSAMSLELGPKGLLVFEDYAKGNTSSSHLAQRKGIPVPQRPTLQPQESGSATSTSVTVYWKVNSGDIIDCFQVYCMEDPQGAVSEEYRVTVKESYCVLEELEPDKTYKVWVMAVNYTGCSLPSERLIFRTAPSVPVIDTERCTVVWDSATLRWSSAKQTPEQSYTLEYCRQYELEGEGLRSISGIKSCEHKVLLQPNENYLFYIKAVNEAGASEQSEAALISTKGTRFHLLKASAHPALELSVDQTTLHYSQDALENTRSMDQQCPSILGELLLAQGRYYWETIVSRSTAYRLGVAYSTAKRNTPLGENSLSWCLQCIPTPSGCRYQLLHNDVQSSVFVIEMAERVGTLLDYQLGLLSFYNAQSGQLLGTFRQRFIQPCHPALALEMPGSLEVSMVQEVPEFTKDS